MDSINRPMQPQAASLAHVAPFMLGPIQVDPSLRRLSQGERNATIEPRTMRVLVALAKQPGVVLSRDDLIDDCWDGVIVGDGAVNRTISQLRRTLAELGDGQVRIETISKVGFRLITDLPTTPTSLEASSPTIAEKSARSPDRRKVLAGSALLGLVGLAGGVWYFTTSAERDPRVQALVERGQIALRDGMPNSNLQGIGFFEAALQISPEDAGVWGILAIAHVYASEYAPPEAIAGAVANVENSAARALALDPAQPEALVALAILPPFYGDWIAADRRYSALYARFPKQIDMIGALGLLSFSTGMAREAADLSQEALALEPLSPVYRYRRSYQLWALGLDSEADHTVDRALELWPEHPAVWYARMLIFAGSDRAEQALRMLNTDLADTILDPLTLAAWRSASRFMLTGAREDRADAVGAAFATARATGAGCVNAILMLSRLDALDEAFEVANGYLLRRGPLAPEIGRLDGAMVNDQRWRKTMMLFTPATAPMRNDGRFSQLMVGTGIGEYWQVSGKVPEFRRTERL